MPQPNLTLTPALSHRMGEGEWSTAGVRIQPLWELQTTDQAVPSPVGREREQDEGRFVSTAPLSGSYFSTNPKRRFPIDTAVGFCAGTTRQVSWFSRSFWPSFHTWGRYLPSLVRGCVSLTHCA